MRVRSTDSGVPCEVTSGIDNRDDRGFFGQVAVGVFSDPLTSDNGRCVLPKSRFFSA